MKTLNNAGDTILEVLIALTVVSSMLGAAYVTSNRSLNNSLQARERGEALKIAEGQFEHLRSLATPAKSAVATTNIFRTGSFCIRAAGDQVVPLASTPPALAMDNYGAYPADCRQNRYHIAMRYDASQEDLFEITVRWDRVREGKDEVRLLYRIHKDTFASSNKFITRIASGKTPTRITKRAGYYVA